MKNTETTTWFTDSANMPHVGEQVVALLKRSGGTQQEVHVLKRLDASDATWGPASGGELSYNWDVVGWIPFSRLTLTEPTHISAVLAASNELFNPAKLGFYDTLEAIAEKTSGSKSWDVGEVFVYAPGPGVFLVMKQVAPGSCEMLTISPAGVEDVLTAYRFELSELVATLKNYLIKAGCPADQIV